MTTTAPLASTRQVDFLNDLLAKRVVPEAIATQIKTTTLTTRVASSYIDLLKSFPYAPRVTSPAEGGIADYRAALEEVPNGFFALPTSDLRHAFPALTLTGDLLFLEVRSFKGVRYLRKLTGGGESSYVRTKLPLAESIGLLKYVALRPVELMQAFGEHESRCGRCGKALTDPESRRVFLGPECRRAVGLSVALRAGN